MKELSRDELRETQISILDYFASICQKYNLTYWLHFGTLLGAVRHKGYIPWDDDIDVAMLREDYEKLIKVFSSIKNGRYRFSCVENDPECMYPMGKLIDESTVLYEVGEAGIKIGVYIDVFVYDNAPMDELERKKAFERLDFYGRLRKYQLPWGEAELSFKRIGALTLKKVIGLLPRQYFTRKIVRIAEKYRNEDTGYVYNITDPYYYNRTVVEKSLFTKQTEVEFEGKIFKAPADYDKLLRILYGDYMKIPSIEEQQASKHDIKAFYIDKNIEE